MFKQQQQFTSSLELEGAPIALSDADRLILFSTDLSVKLASHSPVLTRPLCPYGYHVTWPANEGVHTSLFT